MTTPDALREVASRPVHVRITPAEHDAVARLAALWGCSWSMALRRIVREAATTER